MRLSSRAGLVGQSEVPASIATRFAEGVWA